MQADDYISINQLCEWLQVSRNTVYLWRKKGLPFLGTGGSIRFSKAAVEKWLEDQAKQKKTK